MDWIMGLLKTCFILTLSMIIAQGNVFAAKRPAGLLVDEAASPISRKTVKPRNLGTDSRFKSVSYSPNVAYDITIPYDTSTYLELQEGEIVTSFSFNNQRQQAWDLVPSQNRLYLRPVESNADSQVTVMTNKRVYFLELKAKESTAQDIFKDPDFSFYIKFHYPSEEEGKSIKRYAISLLPNLDQPEDYNFNYTITGEKSIFPLKIFDDGEFTYFEFKDKGGVLPAIFIVDSSNYESLTNYRMLGQYIVVERTSARFTLRNGKDIVCVYNENQWLEERSRRKAN